MLILRGLLGVVFQVALLGAGLYLPAGTWDWPRATQFLVSYTVIVSASVFALARFAPQGLEARLAAPMDRSQPFGDVVASALLFSSMVAWWIFIPLDVFRLSLLPPPYLLVSALGAVVSVGGLGIIMLTIYQNAYVMPIVKEQSDRGQVLVDSGLYGCIRHPMYAGMFLWFIGIALWLESIAAALAVALILPGIWLRIRIEEQTLAESLPGYAEYMARVPYRLLPRVW